MAIQNKSDMSMNEILKSIKNFVSVGEVKAEISSEGERAAHPVTRTEVPPFGQQEVPLLEEERPLSTEEKMRLLEEINMPEFMRRGVERNGQSERMEEITPPSIASNPVNVSHGVSVSRAASSVFDDEREKLNRNLSTQPGASAARLDQRPGVRVALQHFADTVEGLAHSSSPFHGGLDQMMLRAIQSSVDAWLDQHMQAIVEDLVQREIAKIAEEIWKKPQANCRNSFSDPKSA